MSADSVQGPIPTGLWRLNQERSSLLSPKSMTLWIIENSEEELLWVAIETRPEGGSQVLSWRGRYGGPPSPVLGGGVQARLTCSAREGIKTEGEFAGIGAFVEHCTLGPGGTRMVCRGEVKAEDGSVQTYIEDFDWGGESPHSVQDVGERLAPFVNPVQGADP